MRQQQIVVSNRLNHVNHTTASSIPAAQSWVSEMISHFVMRAKFCFFFSGNTNVVQPHRHHHHHHQKRGYHIATTAPQPIANHENVTYYDTQVSTTHK